MILTMDSQELFDKYKMFVKQNLLILALGFVGLTLFVYGLISLFFASSSTLSASQDILFEANDSNSENIPISPKEEKPTASLTVDIEGSVVSPGVYQLPLDSRIQDALVAAGGLSGSADRDYIAKAINLATKLSDGSKIYIPKIGETDKSIGIGTTEVMGRLLTQINVNSASEQDLDSLPGIGPVTAQKIMNGRPYSSINDLLDKKIVGSKVFDQIKEKITVY